MPGGDRTGPMGMGPLTGRGAGYCRGNATPGFANQRQWTGGREVGFGRGGYGRGWRNRFFATGVPGRLWNWGPMGVGSPTTDLPGEDRITEQQYLEGQARFLKSELDVINRRLTELKTQREK